MKRSRTRPARGRVRNHGSDPTCTPKASPSIGTASWAVSLRAAADTLTSAPVTVVCAVSLSGQLSGIAGEQTLLRAVVERLAHEHQLYAQLEIRDEWFSVRLSHPAAEGEPC